MTKCRVHLVYTRAPQILLAVTLLVGAIGLLAQSTYAATVSSDGASPGAPDRFLSPATITHNAMLLTEAQQDGRVRVIVNLKGTYRPEGRLSGPNAILAQRASITRSQSRLLRRLDAAGITVVRQYKYVAAVVLEVDAAGLEQLLAAPEVEDIQEDTLSRPTLASSIPVIGADDAWAGGYAGAGQAVAILDTGVDSGHTFLTGSVVSEACYSTTYGPYGSTTVCPNGQEAQTGTGAGVNCDLSVDGCDHGTHVAGIVAGEGASASGVARDASIIAIQVFSRFDSVYICGSSDPCALSYTSDQIDALERVYELRNDYNIASVNMSLGGGYYASVDDCDAARPTTKAAIDNLRSAGIAVVVASGNDGYSNGLSSPACVSSAISVGATDDSDQVAWFSNSASFLDLLAPGVSINSSIPGGGYSSWNGTSMATPHVAGAWALLKQYSPSASVDDILDALKSTGVSVLDPSNGFSHPRIQVDVVVTGLTAPSNLAATVASNSQISLSWDDNSSNEEGFKIEWSPDGTTGWTQVAAVASGVISYDDTGLRCDTSHSYRVRAYDWGSDSGYSNITESTTSACETNSPPVAEDDTVSTGEDTPVTIDVLTNDHDGNSDSLSLSAIGEPIRGTAVIDDDSVVYTPLPDLHGTDSFTYTSSDGNLSDTATATVTISPVNDPPRAVDDGSDTPQETSITLYPLVNDTDVEGDPLTLAGVSQGENGSVADNGDGSVTYKPTSGFNGSDSFSYTVSDDEGASAKGFVTIIVTASDQEVTVAGVDPGADTELIFTSTEADGALTTTLTIPLEAITDTFTLIYQEVTSGVQSLPVGYVFANRSFTLDAYVNGVLQSNFLFSTPCTITLQYNPNKLNGANEEALELRYWNGSRWATDGITVIERDITGHLLVAALEHLTQFALLGQRGQHGVHLPLVVTS